MPCASDTPVPQAVFAEPGHPDALAVLVAAPDPARGRRLSHARIVSLLRKGGAQRNLERRAADIGAALRAGQLEAPPLVAEAQTPMEQESLDRGDRAGTSTEDARWIAGLGMEAHRSGRLAPADLPAMRVHDVPDPYPVVAAVRRLEHMAVFRVRCTDHRRSAWRASSGRRR
jgi:hypothetical protein